MKILLIDDNKRITDMLSSYLTLKCHECIVANDGKNGLALLEREVFDVTILDIAMPEFCGFDVLKQLNHDEKIIDQNIIVLTAISLSDDDILLLRKYGVKQILTKPVNPKILLHEIEICS